MAAAELKNRERFPSRSSYRYYEINRIGGWRDAAGIFGWHVRADSEIAVAIRYLQAEGVSHSQLYLFREDGKLLRQLTHEKSGQVMSPVFAPDGTTIVFKIVTGKETEYWSVEPKGERLHKFNVAPPWYAAAKPSPFFDDGPRNPLHHAGRITEIVVLDADKEMEESNYDTSKYGKHSQLRDLKTGEKVEFGALEGFGGLYGILRNNGKANDYFLFQPPLRLAFFYVHLNSTAGDTVYALDLTAKKFVQLSDNWATPVPLPGEPAFLTVTEARYESIPGSEKSANCSYLERWDSKLEKVRYGGETAAICHGASMYRPGKKPAVITIGGPGTGG